MTDAGTEVEKRATAPNVVVVPPEHSAQLMEGYAGFVNDHDSTAQERITRLAGLVPVALQVMDESRDTVERLRDENEEIKRQPLLTGSEWQKKIFEAHGLILLDLYRQWRAVHQRIDWADFRAEVEEMFGQQFASAFHFYVDLREADRENQIPLATEADTPAE